MRGVQGLIFLAVLVCLLFLTHWYVWRRLVRDTTGSRLTRWLAAGALALLALSFPTAVATTPRFPAIALIGYVWLAALFYLLLALALTEIGKPLARAILRRRATRPNPTNPPAPADPADRTPLADSTDPAPSADSADPVDSADPTAAAVAGVAAGPETVADPGRRLLVARTAAIVAGLAVAGTVGVGVHNALGTPRIRRVRVALGKLPAVRDGYRIALISDLHLGPLSGAGRTRMVVELVNGLDADAVAICGDLVDGSVDELGAAAAPLAGLRARQGSFFVTGNHDYFSGYRPWLDEVTRLGIQPLHNARTDLGGLVIAGVNDATGGGYGDPPDYAKALDGRDTGVPVVLLAHQPVQVHEAAKHGVDLQLSGHTHGGQMVPFNAVVRAVQPVVSGYARIDGTQLFVTNGVGFWGPPVRIGAPAEVTLVELVRG